MAVTLTQSAVSHSSSVALSYSVSFPSPPAAGSLIVVMCGGQQGIPGASTAVITDNQGNTYTQLAFQAIAQCLSQISACANVAASGTFTITVTYNQLQVHNNFVIEEWAGMPTTLTQDGSSAANGNNNGVDQSCGTLTTANASDLLLAFVTNNGNSPLTETAPAGYTLDQTYLFQVGCGSAYDIVSAPVSALVSFGTSDVTGQWNGVTAALQSQVAASQSLDASMTQMAGALVEKTNYPLAATMSSFAGVLVFTSGLSLDASMSSFSATLGTNLISALALPASMSQFAGALSTQPSRALDASMSSFAGALASSLISGGSTFSATMASFSATLGMSSGQSIGASMAPFSAALAIAVQHGPVPPTCESAACDLTVVLISHIEVCENPGS